MVLSTTTQRGLKSPEETTTMATIIAAPIVASWGPSAMRLTQFLAGANVGLGQIQSDLDVVEGSCLMDHPSWRQDVDAVKRKIQAQKAGVVAVVRRHYTPEESRARRLRHEKNVADRAAANQQMSKLGGSSSKKKH